MYFYTSFGYTISSQIPFEQFQLASNKISPDFTFCYGHFPLPLDELGDHYRRMLSHEGGILLYYRNIGAFLIQEGKRVIIQTLPESLGEEMIRAILMGPALGMLLYQRGKYKVFHGSAVAREDGRGAISFLAVKGGGKSTMTGMMLQSGYSLISDDLLAVRKENDTMLIQPGFPGMKLWDNSVESLGFKPETFSKIGKDGCYEKRFLPVHDRFINNEIPIHTVFILEYGEDDDVRIVPLNSKEALMHCLLHWYGANFYGQLLPVLGVDRHFRECSFLAGNVRICRLIRPKKLDRMQMSVEAVDRWRKEQDLG